jgi:hypothetical protein
MSFLIHPLLDLAATPRPRPQGAALYDLDWA